MTTDVTVPTDLWQEDTDGALTVWLVERHDSGRFERLSSSGVGTRAIHMS